MKRSHMKLDEYTKKLQEKRGKEVITEKLENVISLREGKGLTSPTSDLPTEELKMIQQFMHRSNLIKLGEALPDRKKKHLVLRKFFKHKRNQQVEVYSENNRIAVCYKGKVNIIGRDFVTLTSLKERIWIPFDKIESAKVPYGLPEVSNAHQHVVYDDELRKKLIIRFSQTVAAKDALIQQFFEETLETNLQTWSGTRVLISTEKYEYHGKIKGSANGMVTIKNLKGEQVVLLSDISCVRTVRLFKLLSFFIQKKRLRTSHRT